jgi:hypothetical protein
VVIEVIDTRAGYRVKLPSGEIIERSLSHLFRQLRRKGVPDGSIRLVLGETFVQWSDHESAQRGMAEMAKPQPELGYTSPTYQRATEIWDAEQRRFVRVKPTAR